MAGNNPKIIIVGCGIVGLSTGVSIQNTIPNAEVMIVADAFLQDITSFGAAGIIRISSFKSGDTPTEEIGRRWFHDTYSLCTNLFNSPEAKKAGVSRISGYFLEGNKEELINVIGQMIVGLGQNGSGTLTISGFLPLFGSGSYSLFSLSSFH
ncbi:D-aspartate oxidase [Nymphon striatum]|nr:D-aspartate oxidase [Nymphon striatum]KAG1670489.1 D-aspartate oxidase [Nymphon striatum]